MTIYKKDKNSGVFFPRISVRDSVSFVDSPSLTEQHHADSVNINKLFSKYLKTGIMANQRSDSPPYRVIAEDFDFQEARNKLIDAQAAFDALPSNLRKRFSNDPSEFYNFVMDDSNIDEMKKLGLISPSEENHHHVNPSPSGNEDKNNTSGASSTSKSA